MPHLRSYKHLQLGMRVTLHKSVLLTVRQLDGPEYLHLTGTLIQAPGLGALAEVATYHEQTVFLLSVNNEYGWLKLDKPFSPAATARIEAAFPAFMMLRRTAEGGAYFIFPVDWDNDIVDVCPLVLNKNKLGNFPRRKEV